MDEADSRSLHSKPPPLPTNRPLACFEDAVNKHHIFRMFKPGKPLRSSKHWLRPFALGRKQIPLVFRTSPALAAQSRTRTEQIEHFRQEYPFKLNW